MWSLIFQCNTEDTLGSQKNTFCLQTQYAPAVTVRQRPRSGYAGRRHAGQRCCHTLQCACKHHIKAETSLPGYWQCAWPVSALIWCLHAHWSVWQHLWPACLRLLCPDWSSWSLSFSNWNITLKSWTYYYSEGWKKNLHFFFWLEYMYMHLGRQSYPGQTSKTVTV